MFLCHIFSHPLLLSFGIQQQDNRHHPYMTQLIITIIKTTSEFKNVSVTVTAGVVEVGVVDTHYGVSQPGADAER